MIRFLFLAQQLAPVLLALALAAFVLGGGA
jgi:hypothetical protein